MSERARSQHLATRYADLGTSVFTEMTELAQRFSAVNLGQGFPDFDGPARLIAAAQAALASGRNQYARSSGTPELCAAVARHQRRFYDLEVDPDHDVTITAGATEALFAALSGLVDPGDEVVLLEPFYDSYVAAVRAAGGIPRVVTLHWPDLRWRSAELAAAFGPRTRAVLVNTPHNPSGRVFDRDELAEIVALARAHDAVILSDEVYEHITFERAHVPVATLPGAYERTITLSSGGKTFSLTGWKVGWSVAPPSLTRAVRAAHQFMTFATPAPLQLAIAAGLDSDDAYYSSLRREYLARRDLLSDGLAAAGLPASRPEGAYFACADVAPLGTLDDRAAARALVERAGVVAIPCSAFYAHPDRSRTLRFAFCKTEAVITRALEQLRRLGLGAVAAPRS